MVKPTATVRSATEADVPCILALYQELVITTSDAEQGRIPSLDDCRRVFTDISAYPGHELVVAEHDGAVIGTLVLLIVPNLSHGALPWALDRMRKSFAPVRKVMPLGSGKTFGLRHSRTDRA